MLTFRRVFCNLVNRDLVDADANCNQWLTRFSDEKDLDAQPADIMSAQPTVDITIVPGIFGECIQNYVEVFSDAVENLIKMGYRVNYAPVKGRGSSFLNAEIIRDHIEQQYASCPHRKTILIGYSKGSTDSMTALANFPELEGKVAAFISIAGVINGSPVADNMQDLYESTLGKVQSKTCQVTDGGEVFSLTRSYRLNWIAQHSLPDKLLYFSIATVPEPQRISEMLKPSYSQLSKIDPRNDGQVIYYDQILPKSILLGYINADHWAAAVPFENTIPVLTKIIIDQNHYPRAQLLEASIVIAEKNLARHSEQSNLNTDCDTVQLEK